MSIAMTLFGGVGYSIAAGLALKLWRKNKERVLEFGTSLDDGAARILKDKLGLNVPPSIHNIYDYVITQGVLLVDNFMGNESGVKQFMRFLAGKNDGSGSLEKLKNELVRMDPLKPLEDQIPDEYKPLYNEFKSVTVKEFVKGKLETTIPATAAAGYGGVVELAKKDEEIVRDINRKVAEVKMVKATIIAPPVEPVRLPEPPKRDPNLHLSALWEKLAAESAARKQAMYDRDAAKNGGQPK